MSSEIRQQRVAGLIFEELSILLSGVSKDLRNVRIFVNHEDESITRRELLQTLQKATPFLRRQLAKRLGLRAVPDLLFAYDDLPEKAARVDELLRQLAAERQQTQLP